MPSVKLYIWVLILLTATISSCSINPSNKPNVIIVLTDDQGWGDVGYNGNKMINTPTLDSLSKVGVVIDRFYVSPTCASSRASILTGNYNITNDQNNSNSNHYILPESSITLGDAFSESGYATAYFGKWSNGKQYPHNPLGQGFDMFFGFCGEYIDNYFNSKLQYNGQNVITDGYITDVLTDSVIHFIENTEDPFMAFVAYNTPHTPYQVPDKYYKSYIKKGLDKKTATIYGMCENIDNNVLRIQNILKKSQKLENTIFIYLSDNGSNYVRYNGGLKGRKAQVDEGGVRVSFIFNYPNGEIIPHYVRDGFGAHIDIFPTLVDLCKIENISNNQDGISLVDALTNTNHGIDNRNLFTNQILPQKLHAGSVRTNKYLLTCYPNDTSLYNLKEDPCQINNLVQREKDIVDLLIIDYKNWLKQIRESKIQQEPIQIGNDNYNEIELTASEGIPGHGLRFANGKKNANDWVTNWKDSGDFLKWPLNVVKEGTYKINLKYNCNKQINNNEFKLICQNKFINFEIESEHKKQIINNPDRVKRDEIDELIWGNIIIGELELDCGVCSINLVYNGTSASNIEIKGLEIIASK